MTVDKSWVYAAHFHTIGHLRYAILSYNAHAHIVLPWWSHVTDDVSASGARQRIEHSASASACLIAELWTLSDNWMVATNAKQPSFNFVTVPVIFRNELMRGKAKFSSSQWYSNARLKQHSAWQKPSHYEISIYKIWYMYHCLYKWRTIIE